jgi:hypothetical protein
MGLDMYLHARKGYFPTPIFSEQDPEKFEAIVELSGAEKMVDRKLGYVSIDIQAAYWRKANHIHNWFVQNCQEGEDDCKQAYVSRGQLEELLFICKDLYTSRDSEKALELLPPSPGFFFGSYDIDDWYWENIEETITQINDIFEDIDNDKENARWSFYYQSSW